MNIRLLPLAAIVVVLAGCQAPKSARSPASQRDSTQADRWIERRAAQYEQMGLKKGDAAMKAVEEWKDLGYSTESYTLYDSSAKQRAAQEKFEDDLTKTKKSN